LKRANRRRSRLGDGPLAISSADHDALFQRMFTNPTDRHLISLCGNSNVSRREAI
jgi:hypothetical protein